MSEQSITRQALQKMEEIRALGCAACVITPEDIITLTEDYEGEPTITEEQAKEWLSLHHWDVEEAIMGDYWSDSVRAVIDQYPIIDANFAVRVGLTGSAEGTIGKPYFETYDEAEAFAETVRSKPGYWASVEQLRETADA